MTTEAIRLNNVGKRYRLHGGPSSLAAASAVTRKLIRRLLGAGPPAAPPPNDAGEFWALRDVTFEHRLHQALSERCQSMFTMILAQLIVPLSS